MARHPIAYFNPAEHIGCQLGQGFKNEYRYGPHCNIQTLPTSAVVADYAVRGDVRYMSLAFF
jgi:hypothetical protein